MLWGQMSRRFLKNLVIYPILILYVLIPVFDTMLCADCLDSTPFEREMTIGHLQTPHDDVINLSRDVAQSETFGERTATSFCSICANFLMGVDVFASQVHLSVVPWDGPCDLPALSNLAQSIDKPPQNLLA